MGFSNYNGTDVEYEEETKSKKFVLTRGKLILLIIIILVIITSIVIIVIKNKPKEENYTMQDFQYLESRMIEEAPNYLYQKQIETIDGEYRIDLAELLEENGGFINSSKVKAAKICEGYVLVTENEAKEYQAFIECNGYTTDGYFKKEIENTTTKKSKDNTKPVISLIGDKKITINTSEEYVEQGAVAIDNMDGDITSQIEIDGFVDSSMSGVYEIIYTVTDSSNNKAKEVRIITVIDITPTTTSPKITTTSPGIPIKTTNKRTTQKKVTTTKKIVSNPIITLKGKSTMTLKIGDVYVEPGYTAIDGLGKDITSKVIVKSKVNTNYAENYEVSYTVTDDYGNTSSVKRFVNVKSGDVSIIGLSLTPNNRTIKKGSSLILQVGYNPSNATNKTVTFNSSNTNVATVDSNGIVYAKTKGEAFITVTSYNGKTATIKVFVTN